MDKIIIAGVELTADAAEWTREVGMSAADVARDVSMLLESGDLGFQRLVETCMDGADSDRYGAIHEYVAAVVRAAEDQQDETRSCA